MEYRSSFQSCSFTSKTATISNADNSEVQLKYDLLIGADGPNSGVRAYLEREGKIHLNQTLDDRAYLTFPVRNISDFSRAPANNDWCQKTQS